MSRGPTFHHRDTIHGKISTVDTWRAETVKEAPENPCPLGAGEDEEGPPRHSGNDGGDHEVVEEVKGGLSVVTVLSEGGVETEEVKGLGLEIAEEVRGLGLKVTEEVKGLGTTEEVEYSAVVPLLGRTLVVVIKSQGLIRDLQVNETH
jgi:hypothetical protein